jgi:1-acyl-sn-glycerol-3-phosphate acyltransferase
MPMSLPNPRSLWIMAQTACATFWYTCLAIYRNRLGTRQDVDQVIRRWARTLLKIVKMSYTVYNPHNVNFTPNHPYIVMSNHASLYDIPLIFLSFPNTIRMIAKKELTRIPIWRQAMKACEIPIIDRHNPSQAIKDLEVVKEKMLTGMVIWIAPEGTRSRHGGLNPFKKGGFMLALQTGATIIPVGIRGTGKILPPDTFHFNTGQSAEVHIGEPIEASAFSLAERNRLIAEVRKRIEAALGKELNSSIALNA